MFALEVTHCALAAFFIIKIPFIVYAVLQSKQGQRTWRNIVSDTALNLFALSIDHLADPAGLHFPDFAVSLFAQLHYFDK